MKKQVKAKIASNKRKSVRNGKTVTRRVIVPEYVKPKRRTKVQMEAIREVMNPASGIKPQKPVRRQACQYIHTGLINGDTNRHSSKVMVVEQEDLDFLQSGSHAIVFVSMSSVGYVIRVTSEKHSNDYVWNITDPLLVVKRILKALQEDSFESAVVVTSIKEITDVINGNEAQDEENPVKRAKKGWTEAHEKVNRLASRQKLTGEYRETKKRRKNVESPSWKDQHLNQLSSLKDNYLVWDVSKVEGNFVRHYVNKV
jgi:hypothetical protein